MAIWGINCPKFTGDGDPDSNTVTLDYAILDPTWNDPRLIEQQSVVTGKKTWITLGDYASFKVTVQLFRYTSPTPSAKFTTLMTYLHKLVYFYPHKDGSTAGDGLGKAIQNSTPANVKFFISAITPYYMNNANDLKDIVDIEFVAENYVDISQNLQ